MTTPKLVLVAAPRGWCAGVERAVMALDCALRRFGPPLYVRHQIVHNRKVVEDFRRRGVVFVDSEREVPAGARMVFSAHGVAPQVRRAAAQAELKTIDATCPLVTKVHVEARRFVAAGFTVAFIAHRDHPEAVGVIGEAPNDIVLVETIEDVESLRPHDPTRVAWISQTTLSVDDTAMIVDRLRKRFPEIVGPRTDDICFATTNRQQAVKALARDTDLILVVGSPNSSNSNRLVEVARSCGTTAFLIGSVDELRDEWFVHTDVVGVTSGASTPDELVQQLLADLSERGAEIRELEVAREQVRFMLPVEVRGRAAPSRSAGRRRRRSARHPTPRPR
jgi:4-hydroxy-3-methylbut-2-enyl diphosphate reductase